MTLRLVSSLLILTVASGCASPQLNCDQQCAMSDMWCEGVTTGTIHNRAPLAPDHDVSSAQCRKPSGDKERAQINLSRESAEAEVGKTKTKNLWTTIGVIGGFILLGIATMPK